MSDLVEGWLCSMAIETIHKREGNQNLLPALRAMVDLICEMNLYVRLFTRTSQIGSVLVSSLAIQAFQSVEKYAPRSVIVWLWLYPRDGTINRSTLKLKQIAQLRKDLLLLSKRLHSLIDENDRFFYRFSKISVLFSSDLSITNIH